MKNMASLTASRPESYLLGMGGGRISLSLHNVRRDKENYDNENSRMFFSVRSATGGDDVIYHLNYVMISKREPSWVSEFPPKLTK